jgi:hypothetical protein
MPNIDLSGDWDRALALPGVIPRLAERLPKIAAEQYTTLILDWIEGGHSFVSRTGQLEQSIGWRPDSGGAVIFANAQHAGYVEGGTRPHVILPVEGRKALKIPVSGGQGYIIRRKVHHPGSKSMPFFFADLDNRITKVTESLLEEIANQVGGNNG